MILKIVIQAHDLDQHFLLRSLALCFYVAMVADHEKRSCKLSVQNRLHNIAMFCKVKDLGQLKKARKGVREETGYTLSYKPVLRMCAG